MTKGQMLALGGGGSVPHDAMKNLGLGVRSYSLNTFPNIRSDFGEQQEVTSGRRYRPDLSTNPAAIALGMEAQDPKPNMPLTAYQRYQIGGGKKPTVARPTIENTVQPEFQEKTNVPPPQANEVAIKPVFDQPAQQSANQIFGDLFARQNAVGAPPLFKKKCNKYKK